MKKGIEQFYRKFFPKRMPDYNAYLPYFSGKKGLEIGGPSAIFQPSGFLPIYTSLGSLDNCTFSNETVWEGHLLAGKNFNYTGNKWGNQYISEGNDLSFAQDNTYDCILSCHNFEHYANPLKALKEWKRVVRNNGALLLIVPHKDNTFDHRRPITTIEHLIEDEQRQIGEDDTTHFEEVIQLHDLVRDPARISREALMKRTYANLENRCVHHHVFNTQLLAAALQYTGWTIKKVNWMNPYHIIMLAQNIEGAPDNTRWIQPQAFMNSPFPSDQ